MKVGYTFIRLAWAAFAHSQASRLLSLLMVWSLLSLQATGTNPPIEFPTVIPFRLVGNSMFVDATVNGQSGYFLFDTGAAGLILNSAHFAGTVVESHDFEVLGLHGEAIPTGRLWDQEIALGGVSIVKTIALVLDLSNMEQIKHIPIAGIIGYAVLKNVEFHINFECREITLFILNGSKQPAWNYHKPPSDSFDIKMSGHIPYLNVQLSGKRLRMGLDTGSERNILQSDMIEEQYFQQRGQLRLAGLSKEEAHLRVGFVHDFAVGGLQAESLEVVLADLQQVSAELPVRLHGILGIAFMRPYKVAINYQRRKIYLWQPQNIIGDERMELCRVAD